MATPQERIDTFIETQYRNSIAKQQLIVDGAKAVALFSSGVAATFTATALQVGTFSDGDGVAVALLVLTFVLTLLVFILDNLTDGPDLVWVAAQAAGDLDRHLDGLLTGLLTSTIENKRTVSHVFFMLLAQCFVCLLTVAAVVKSVA